MNVRLIIINSSITVINDNTDTRIVIMFTAVQFVINIITTDKIIPINESIDELTTEMKV